MICNLWDLKNSKFIRMIYNKLIILRGYMIAQLQFHTWVLKRNDVPSLKLPRDLLGVEPYDNF